MDRSSRHSKFGPSQRVDDCAGKSGVLDAPPSRSNVKWRLLDWLIRLWDDRQAPHNADMLSDSFAKGAVYLVLHKQ